MNNLRKRLFMIVFWLLTITMVLSRGAAEAAIKCYECHGTKIDSSTGDYRPVDASYRNHSTGGFQGNHRTHMGEGANPLTCSKCHPGSENYLSSHSCDSKNRIKVSSNINASPHPSKAIYKNNTSAWPQTVTPNLGSCTNVNCHFESNTPAWGNDPALTTCTTCHGVPPAGYAASYSGGANGSHWPHNAFYPGVNNCIKCHPDHTVESNPFAHATSIGKRAITIRLRDPFNNIYGSFSAGTRDYLPSQVGTHTYGTCKNTYCHSTVQADGGTGEPAYGRPTWGANLNTCNTTCHGVGGGTHNNTPTISTGSHSRHLAYNFGLASPSPIGNCTTCHHWPSVSTQVGVVCAGCHVPHNPFGGPPFYAEIATKHANGAIDVAFNATFTNGSYNGSPVPRSGYSTCSNVYCHSSGVSVSTGTVPANTSPSWGSGTLACNACHGNKTYTDFRNAFPLYTTKRPTTKANSHKGHLAYSCEKCHYNTTTDGVTITNTANHVNKAYNVDAGAGASFTYTYNSAGGGCANISCHGSTSAQWGGSVGCLDCHSGTIGNRASIISQFGANSHHIQGVPLTNAHCYQCHWEANSDGTINQTYHHSATPGAPVELVVYGAGARPVSYTPGITAVQYHYTTTVNRAGVQKITTHCLGCHSEQNNETKPFGDCKTPRQYSWDLLSIAARYSQMSTTKWGKYSSTTVSQKYKITKALSAHGNAVNNQGGWNPAQGTDKNISNTRNGTQNVQCFDCHNSHGSTVAGVTSSYVSYSGQRNGAILKDTVAGKGGYAVAYKAQANTVGVNPYSAGAGQCFDCHMTANNTATPWGYQSTFGANKPVKGYRDAYRFGDRNYTDPYAGQAYKMSSVMGNDYKQVKQDLGIAGGHLKASGFLKYSTSARNRINGLCTPCHDPHGVSPSLGDSRQYGVPLLKDTWLSSPYKEDYPSPNPSGAHAQTTASGKYWGSTIYQGDRNQNLNDPTIDPPANYNIDRNVFGTADGILAGVSNKISQDATQFAGLCIKCHSQERLFGGYAFGTATSANRAPWKSVKRIHASVKGWGTNKEHNFSCSKCHQPHNSSLPRLMQTNCLDYNHRGFLASGGVAASSLKHVLNDVASNILEQQNYRVVQNSQVRGYPTASALGLGGLGMFGSAIPDANVSCHISRFSSGAEMVHAIRDFNSQTSPIPAQWPDENYWNRVTPW